jgi:proton-translocating NADH-quinone oxidoreductase chain M
MILIGLLALSIWAILWPKISVSVCRWVNLCVNAILLLIVTVGLIWKVTHSENVILEGVETEFRGITDLFLLTYDGISLVYIWLTIFIFLVTFLSVWNNVKQPKFLLLILNSIQLLLIGSFLSSDMLLFYILFESILIPMFLLIGIWGSRSEKIKATYYLFFYTLVGSVLFIISIVYIQIALGTTNSFLVITSEMSQKWLWVFLFIAFGVKIPMFPFHIWLPEAHVEAPTAGSVILAALLLKLGSYAYLRFMLPIFDLSITNFFWPLIISFAGSSVVLASLTAIRQIDIKRIVAYSSIAHMNLAVLGLFSNQLTGLTGGFILTVAHGFVSAAMFLLIGVLYDRYHSRLITHYSGLARVMPLYAIFFILFSLANLGFPFSYNFIGELSIIIGLVSMHFFYGIVGLIGVLLSVIYVMWLVNRLLFGDISVQYITQFYDLDTKEVSYLTILFIPVILFGIFPDVLELLWYNDLQLLLI